MVEKEILLVGEPMGLFISKEVGSFEDVEEFYLKTCGAELNVAMKDSEQKQQQSKEQEMQSQQQSQQQQQEAQMQQEKMSQDFKSIIGSLLTNGL